MDCEYIETESSDTALLTVAYVMAGVCGLCLLPIFVLLGQASCKRRKQQQQRAAAEAPANDTTSLRSDFYNNWPFASKQIWQMFSSFDLNETLEKIQI